jgi:hypothetical protein
METERGYGVLPVGLRGAGTRLEPDQTVQELLHAGEPVLMRLDGVERDTSAAIGWLTRRLRECLERIAFLEKRLHGESPESAAPQEVPPALIQRNY